MDRRARRFLEELLLTPGPSGFEGAVQDVWRTYVRSQVGPVTRDVHGNQAATVRGRSARGLLLVAHADEVGLIVQYIDDEGFLYSRAIGGVDAGVLPSQRVTVLGRKGAVRGVIGKRPHHLREKDGGDKPLRLEDLPIDIGASSRSQAEESVEVGDPIVVGDGLEAMGGRFITARNLDNRIGCFIVAEVLRILASRKTRPSFTVHGISSVQEETGVRGAAATARRLRPAAAIAVDVTHDTRQAGVKVQQHGDVRCGRGPVLTRGVRTSKVLLEELRRTAREAGIPVQTEIDGGHTGTDADSVSEQMEGIPVGLVSVPCRYMHTSCEVITLADAEAAVDLLAAAAARLDPDLDFTLRA